MLNKASFAKAGNTLLWRFYPPRPSYDPILVMWPNVPISDKVSSPNPSEKWPIIEFYSPSCLDFRMNYIILDDNFASYVMQDHSADDYAKDFKNSNSSRGKNVPQTFGPALLSILNDAKVLSGTKIVKSQKTADLTETANLINAKIAKLHSDSALSDEQLSKLV